MIEYRQCELRKDNLIQTAWLPKVFCKMGNFVDLGRTKPYDKGWRVHTVGTTSPPAYVLENKRDRRSDFGSLA